MTYPSRSSAFQSYPFFLKISYRSYSFSTDFPSFGIRSSFRFGSSESCLGNTAVNTFLSETVDLQTYLNLPVRVLLSLSDTPAVSPVTTISYGYSSFPGLEQCMVSLLHHLWNTARVYAVSPVQSTYCELTMRLSASSPSIIPI